MVHVLTTDQKDATRLATGSGLRKSITGHSSVIRTAKHNGYHDASLFPTTTVAGGENHRLATA